MDTRKKKYTTHYNDEKFTGTVEKIIHHYKGMWGEYKARDNRMGQEYMLNYLEHWKKVK